MFTKFLILQLMAQAEDGEPEHSLHEEYSTQLQMRDGCCHRDALSELDQMPVPMHIHMQKPKEDVYLQLIPLRWDLKLIILARMAGQPVPGI